jgi:predicted nucleic acid-binding protein
MPNAFIDTNILIYAADPDINPGRQTRLAREILFQEHLVISVQVINEFIANSRNPNKLALDPSDERAWLQKFFRLEVASQSPDTVYLALRLQAFHSLSHWDALIVASALEADCTTLYSENLGHGANYDGVTVINPFREESTM